MIMKMAGWHVESCRKAIALMKAVSSTETSATIHKTTGRYVPENSYRQ
jgi:hypothetical protein